MLDLNEWLNRLINQTYFCQWNKGAMGIKLQRSVLSKEHLKKKKKESWIEASGNIEGADQWRNRICRTSPINGRKRCHFKYWGHCVRWVEVRIPSCHGEEPWLWSMVCHCHGNLRVANISGIPAPLCCDEWRHDVASSSGEWGPCHLFCTPGSFSWFNKDLSSLKTMSPAYKGKKWKFGVFQTLESITQFTTTNNIFWASALCQALL